MSDLAHVLQARRNWISLYEETDDAGLVCRRCGISRLTLRKWWCRFQQHGELGLLSNSRRPHSSHNKQSHHSTRGTDPRAAPRARPAVDLLGHNGLLQQITKAIIQHIHRRGLKRIHSWNGSFISDFNKRA